MFFKSLLKRCLLLGMGVGVSLLTGCSQQPARFHTIDLTGANYAQRFQLSDQHGQVRQLSDFAGSVVVVFFGFTQCPDVCPTTLLELAQIKKNLGPDGKRLQALFVTLDPARDTPAVLKAYMANFDPTFLALSTPPDQVDQLAAQFKIFHRKVEGSSPSTYTIDHTAGSYVYDPQGRLRLFARYGTPVEQLQADLQLLLQGK